MQNGALPTHNLQPTTRNLKPCGASSSSLGGGNLEGGSRRTKSARADIYGQRIRVPAGAPHLTGLRRWAHSAKFPRREWRSMTSEKGHVDTSLEEIRSHNSVIGDVFGASWNDTRTANIGKRFADRVFPINEAADLATRPDVMFRRRKTSDSGRVRLVERVPGSGWVVEAHGSPRPGGGRS